MYVLTASQMQRVDAETIDRVCPGIELMERAGTGCARFLLHAYGGHATGDDERSPAGAGAADAARADTHRGERAAPRAAVFAGGGNNGGDGFVVARVLARAGWRVSVHVLRDPSRLPPDASRNHRRLVELARTCDHLVVHEADEADWIPRAVEDADEADVIVDALLGTGTRGAPRGATLDAIRIVNDAPAPVVSIDVPSGVSGETGEAPGEAVVATHTLTIGVPKVGLLFHPGRYLAGRVHVIDIGFPEDIVARHADRLLLLDVQEAAARLPWRAPDTHKFDAGTLMVLAGSRRFRGAALLCAEAALRSGCGMVYLGVPEGIAPAIDVALREAIVVPLPETPAGTLAVGALDVLGDVLGRAHALAVGPGLDRHDETDRFVDALLDASDHPVVVDADAVAAFAGRADALAAHARDRALVVTPHDGELRRLLGDAPPRPPLERIAFAREAASRLGATLVHKGAPALVAGDGDDGPGCVYVCASGSDALATGGTGDVLTGFVGGMLAQGAEGLDAALVATFLHGRAGDTAAAQLGRRGVVAGDLLWAFGETLRALERLAGERSPWPDSSDYRV